MQSDYQKLFDDEDYVEIKRHPMEFWSQAITAILLFLAFNMFLSLFMGGFDRGFPWIRVIGNTLVLLYGLTVYWRWKKIKYLGRGKEIVIVHPFKTNVLQLNGTMGFTVRQGFWQKRFGYGVVGIVDPLIGSPFYLSYVIDPYGTVKRMKDIASKELVATHQPESSHQSESAA